MADLRVIAQAISLTDVRTYIQSGNLVASTAEHPAAVKAALEDRLTAYAGRPVGVSIRTADEMRAVLDANPFPQADPSKVGVLFLDAAPSLGTRESARGRADEVIELGRCEVFIHYPSGMGRTKLRLAALPEGTVRNMNTVANLVRIAIES